MLFRSYICDAAANRIYRARRDGTLELFAGSGAAGLSGNGGRAAAATLRSPRAISFDPSGNLFIADTGNSEVRAVLAGAGTIIRVAGGRQGFSGDGGPAIVAALNRPRGCAADSDGNVYVADTDNHRIRAVSAVVLESGPAEIEDAYEDDGSPRGRSARDEPADE